MQSIKQTLGNSRWQAAQQTSCCCHVRLMFKPRRSQTDLARASKSSQYDTADLVTLEEVQQAAKNRGLVISVKDLGPLYRIVCREVAAGNEEGRILATTSGFIVPLLGLMHCDMLQVFTKGLKGDTGDRIRGGALGLGLLMGGAVFSYGLKAGCHKAEILAINDDDEWHQRLVRYYSFFGFEPVAVVEGSQLSDLPHMLVWGGAGTRMDADVRKMLAKWSPSLRRAARGVRTVALDGRGTDSSGASPPPTSPQQSNDTAVL